MSSIPPCQWCISFEQLLDLDSIAREHFGTKDYPTKTTRDIVNEIITPTCNDTGLSYALSLNPNGLPIQVFVTHSWDGCFEQLVASLEQAYLADVEKPNLWICALALLQSTEDIVIEAQVGTNVAQAPFVQALIQATEYCVIRNSNRDIYSRIWCVAELMYAHRNKLRTRVSGPDDFANNTTSCTSAEAYLKADKERILKVLRTEFNLADIDRLVGLYRKHGSPPIFKPFKGRGVEDMMLSGLNTLVAIMAVVSGARFVYSLVEGKSYDSFASNDELRHAVLAVSAATKHGRSSLAPQSLVFQTYGPIEKWDVSKVESFESLFEGYRGPNYDLSAWDTSAVTDMSKMFKGSTFNGGIRVWKTSLVKTMINMFDSSSFNQDIGSWDLSNVMEMSYMFKNSTFNACDLAWNTAATTRMDGVFWDSQFTGDVSGWNTAAVTSMNYLFMNSLFNGDVSHWRTHKVTSMNGMFLNSAFNGNVVNWDVSNVLTADRMFQYNKNFNQDLSEWKFRRLTSARSFLEGPFCPIASAS